MRDPARRAVLDHALSAAAEEMGEILQRAAFSPNIKERRDHSCAVFTPEAELIAQAEHIPVHLGAMPLAVDAILDVVGTLGPGDVAVSNSPQHGGTHLPDVTMVQPVFHGGERVAYVAARAHHADVGGDAPGSMPATATRLEEEGVVIEPCVAHEGEEGWPDEVGALLEATRSPQEREGDLAAQVGALRVGADRVASLATREGHARLREGMGEIIDHARRLTKARLEQATAGSYRAREELESWGARVELAVEARLGGKALVLDYEGTGDQVSGNVNAPKPVTVAGAVYVARVLLGPEIPSNAGMLDRIRVHVPEGSVLNPSPGAAVAGGNVETSQRNVDVLFSALGEAFDAPAQSQGTMNNVTMGLDGVGGFAYYETIGGGEGGLHNRAGRSGIHSHMTNTQNTPVEAIEHAYPLRVIAQTLRRGSGGEGEHAGGEGIVRAVEAVVDGVEVNLITTRRSTHPKGACGGGPGASGENEVKRAGGGVETLGGIDRVVLDAGDVLWLRTPGGGGWGRPEQDG